MSVKNINDLWTEGLMSFFLRSGLRLQVSRSHEQDFLKDTSGVNGRPTNNQKTNGVKLGQDFSK